MTLKQGESLFRPPQGLEPNEEVLWVQQSETRNSGKSGVVSMMLVGSLFLASGLYYNILPILGIGILIIIGGIFVACVLLAAASRGVDSSCARVHRKFAW